MFRPLADAPHCASERSSRSAISTAGSPSGCARPTAGRRCHRLEQVLERLGEHGRLLGGRGSVGEPGDTHIVSCQGNLAAPHRAGPRRCFRRLVHLCRVMIIKMPEARPNRPARTHLAGCGGRSSCRPRRTSQRRPGRDPIRNRLAARTINRSTNRRKIMVSAAGTGPIEPGP